MGDDRTEGSRILHVQPVNSLCYFAAHPERDAGGSLVGNWWDYRTTDTFEFTGRDCRNNSIITGSIYLPFTMFLFNRDGRLIFQDASSFRFDGMFERIDEGVESTVEITKAFPGYSPVRSDCNPAYQPCCRDFFTTLPELTLEEWFKE